MSFISSQGSSAQGPSRQHRLARRAVQAGQDMAYLARRVSHHTMIGGVDMPLVYITLVMAAFGLMAVYTASAHQALQETGNSLSILIKQILALAVGLGGMVMCSRMSFTFWLKSAKPMAFLSIGLLILTMLVGSTANGSERWLPLPFGFQFQPSDFAKLSAIALIAEATGKKRLMNFTLFMNLALIGVMILLIYQQPNLSVSIILGALTLMMLFVGGLPIYLYVVLMPLLSMGVFHKIRHTEYQWKRITGWLNPWKDAQDSGYNLIQSYYAIGSGGVFGVGLGHSMQKLYYLPFQYTDFIFAVICEELGLIGALIVLGLFAMFAWRGFSIAFKCPSSFGQMLAFGLTASIILQALINISVNVGLMPVTGVTLPLISYGGTSMVITLCMIGILLSISRYQLNPRIESSLHDDWQTF